jgi:stringent starvation protein B
MASEPLPQRPYLLRAMHEWMSDGGFTPHIIVDVAVAGVEVPRQHVENGKIVLNVSYSATRNLELGNDQVSFETRFAGTPHHVFVPVASILGIYARESGEGLIFSEPEGLVEEGQGRDLAAIDAIEQSTASNAESKSGSDRPHLRVIK